MSPIVVLVLVVVVVLPSSDFGDEGHSGGIRILFQADKNVLLYGQRFYFQRTYKFFTNQGGACKNEGALLLFACAVRSRQWILHSARQEYRAEVV